MGCPPRGQGPRSPTSALGRMSSAQAGSSRHREGWQQGTASSWASSGSRTTATKAQGPWGMRQLGMGREPDPPHLPFSMGWALPPAPGSPGGKRTSTCKPLRGTSWLIGMGQDQPRAPHFLSPLQKGLLPRDTSRPRPGDDRSARATARPVYFQQQHLKIPSGCVILRSRAWRAVSLVRL